MRSGYTQTFAGGYHATWRTVFKNFARRPPVRRFGLGVAPILAGANGLPELDLLESAMASTLRITEVSVRAVRYPFCGLKTSAASPS